MRFSRFNLGCIVLVACARAGATLPPNFADQLVMGGWNQAVGMTFSPNGTMYVWERAGRVWIVESGVKRTPALIDINDEVGNWGDYGLLGFALDPNFAANGYIYLLYVVDYYHLTHAGLPGYNPNANDYNRPTIGRLTRYTCNPADGFHSVIPGSRLVLIGESAGTGFPICSFTHGIGTLQFAPDGTLLAGCGDGAGINYEPTSGGCSTGVADGILRPKEDIGSFRAQLVDCMSGKIVRIDPATGDGIPSNPFFDSANPRSARSRVWALGFRNPYRFVLRPGTGSTNSSAGQPGTLIIGDVGWSSWEEMDVCRTGGTNFGWPIYEGLEASQYLSATTANPDAPNPLFGVGGCTQQFLRFKDLLIQDTLSPSFPNPCDAGQQIPPGLNRFVHKRPAMDWYHASQPSRTGIYNGNQAAVINIGAAGSPIQGPQFGGACSVGGVWYNGTNFPPVYHGTYFNADYVGGWIKSTTFDAADNPTVIRDFGSNLGAVVALAINPLEDAIYYLRYGATGASEIRRITYTTNVPPVVSLSATPYYGSAPLSVQFSTAGTYDPEGGALTYAWDFGDGSPVSRVANPLHQYSGYRIEDITMQGTFVAKVFSLNPPNPIGGGNPNPEVMRDGDYPPVGIHDEDRQYDTYHNGDQGNEDWIGYTFATPRTFAGMIFQEGNQFNDGGFFLTLTVQVRQAGVWNNVSNLVIGPPYPGGNGITFERFDISFDPVLADGIRIYGQPGGSSRFISVGELRALAWSSTPDSGPTPYFATVTVTDPLAASSAAQALISLNNSPPVVNIISPVDGSTYPLTETTTLPLIGQISDAEDDSGQLACSWQTILHHNTHAHPGSPDPTCQSQTVLNPAGCDGDTYFYEVQLTVSDTGGLATTSSVYIFPDCIYGDLNCDNLINELDVTPFAQALIDPSGYTGCDVTRADLNHDSVIDADDIEPFLATLNLHHP